MSRPRVSIITVCFNAEACIGKTLQSVASLAFQDYEHLIVDGKSADATLELVAREGTSRTRVVSEKDAGIFDAMNKGIDLAQGEFLWFLNAGDSILDGSFLQSLAWDRDFYYGGVLITLNGREVRRMMPSRFANPALSVFGQLACHQSMLVRKSKAVKYDLQYRFVSDYDWSVRILKRGDVRPSLVPAYWVDYELDGFSTRNAERCWEERVRVMRSQFGAWTVPVMLVRRQWFRVKERIKRLLGR